MPKGPGRPTMNMKYLRLDREGNIIARRRNATRYTKKPARVNRKVKRNTARVTRLPKGLTERLNITLCYSDISNYLTGAAPTYNSYVLFTMTNLVDPDISGSGAQPPLFDNLQALYHRWRVNSCKLIVEAQNGTNIPTYVTLVGLFEPGTNSPTVPSNQTNYDLLALSSKERSDRYLLSPASYGGADSSQKIIKTFYPKDFVGPEYFTSVNYSGINGSAPNNYPSIAMIAQTMEPGTGSEVGIWYSYRLEFDVTFYDPITAEIAAYD